MKKNNRLFGGYIYVLKPEHPNATLSGYMAEQRLVMEQHLGRYLEKDELIHHIDGDKLNNNLENLHLCTRSVHGEIHRAIGKLFNSLYEKGIIRFDRKENRYYEVHSL